jgi:hypothetical protein
MTKITHFEALLHLAINLCHMLAWFISRTTLRCCKLNKESEISSHHKKLNSVAFSPQVNYTDRATSACRPN